MRARVLPSGVRAARVEARCHRRRSRGAPPSRRVSATGSSAIETNRGAVRGVRVRFRATTSAPGFGIPIAFTIARRAGSRAIRGCGFRGAARASRFPYDVSEPERAQGVEAGAALCRTRRRDRSGSEARPGEGRSSRPGRPPRRRSSSTAAAARADGAPGDGIVRGRIEKNTRRPTLKRAADAPTELRTGSDPARGGRSGA